jgi:hypothetical protein
MNSIYQIAKNRTNRNVLNGNLSSLKDLNCDHNFQTDQNQIIQLFCNDLKKLLMIEDLRELIKNLNQLDQLLISLKEKGEYSDLPNLDDFFRILSPVLLRSVSQTLDTISQDEKNNFHSNGEESLLMGWLESLRISIEEEIHIWQEKLI